MNFCDDLIIFSWYLIKKNFFVYDVFYYEMLCNDFIIVIKFGIYFDC